jgi:hypothetical protein
VRSNAESYFWGVPGTLLRSNALRLRGLWELGEENGEKAPRIEGSSEPENYDSERLREREEETACQSDSLCDDSHSHSHVTTNASNQPRTHLISSDNLRIKQRHILKCTGRVY